MILGNLPIPTRTETVPEELDGLYAFFNLEKGGHKLPPSSIFVNCSCFRSLNTEPYIFIWQYELKYLSKHLK